MNGICCGFGLWKQLFSQMSLLTKAAVNKPLLFINKISLLFHALGSMLGRVSETDYHVSISLWFNCLLRRKVHLFILWSYISLTDACCYLAITYKLAYLFNRWMLPHQLLCQKERVSPLLVFQITFESNQSILFKIDLVGSLAELYLMILRVSPSKLFFILCINDLHPESVGFLVISPNSFC